MRRIIVIFLPLTLITITCSEVHKKGLANLTATLTHPLFYAHHAKVLRQGLERNAPEPQPTHPPKHDCVCSKIYDPVCASNNESYFNLCLLECKVPQSTNVTVVHQGNCIPF